MRVRAHQAYHNAAGKKVTSVTTALSILNKPGLVKWANNLGLLGIDSSKYKDELADIGTLTHYFVMCHLKDIVPEVREFSQEQIDLAEVCYRKYLDWEKYHPIRPILVEEPFVSEEYQFGGQVDCYGVCEKDLMLLDLKTSKGIFDEMIYQVSAYSHMLVENGYKVSSVRLLRIGRSPVEGFDEKVLTDERIEVGWQIFLHCLAIYNLRTKGVK